MWLQAVLPGQPQDHWCRVCHHKLRVSTDGVRFTQLEPSRNIQSESCFQQPNPSHCVLNTHLKYQRKLLYLQNSLTFLLCTTADSTVTVFYFVHLFCILLYYSDKNISIEKTYTILQYRESSHYTKILTVVTVIDLFSYLTC